MFLSSVCCFYFHSATAVQPACAFVILFFSGRIIHQFLFSLSFVYEQRPQKVAVRWLCHFMPGIFPLFWINFFLARREIFQKKNIVKILQLGLRRKSIKAEKNSLEGKMWSEMLLN